METIWRDNDELVVPRVGSRARMVVGVAELHPQAELPQLSSLEKAAVPRLRDSVSNESRK
jgi:hypothetical protein